MSFFMFRPWSSMIFVLVVFVSTAASFASFVVAVLLGALFAPRLVLEACCPNVVVSPGVSSPNGSWGCVDDAARASGCRTAIYKRRWAIRQSPSTIRFGR